MLTITDEQIDLMYQHLIAKMKSNNLSGEIDKDKIQYSYSISEGKWVFWIATYNLQGVNLKTKLFACKDAEIAKELQALTA